MRNVINLQMKIGEVDIADIKFDLRSRDEIPKLLRGLQHIYCDPKLRAEVFEILETLIPQGINAGTGRPGMELWKILVLGVLRLNCNWDYDKLKEIADNHRTVREMLGHTLFDRYSYPLQTLKDNISLFTPEIIDKINQIVVKTGHRIFKKKEEPLRGRCDSFVMETDVHFPTDISLLFDAVRRIIRLIAFLCCRAGVAGWRQSEANIRKLKQFFNYVRKLKHTTAKDETKKAQQWELIAESHREYTQLAEYFVEKGKMTVETLRGTDGIKEEKIIEIERFIRHAERQIDQIRRRVIDGKTIPHSEKVFSNFEEHTEWISKGKAGVPQELGLKVCMVEDHLGFILHHHVMQRETDDKIAVRMVQETQNRFPEFRICSFDKGFYTPENRNELRSLLDFVVLPQKGRLSEQEREIESSGMFVQLRHQHSAVESAINALENHSMDRCPDHGLTGFERYAALAILARNFQILGHKFQQKETNTLKRKEKYRMTYTEKRAA